MQRYPATVEGGAGDSRRGAVVTMAHRPCPWSRLLRDVAIAIALLFVTWQCWQQAQRHAPAFQMSECRRYAS